MAQVATTLSKARAVPAATVVRTAFHSKRCQERRKGAIAVRLGKGNASQATEVTRGTIALCTCFD